MHMHVCVHACVCHNVLSVLYSSAKPSKTKVSSCYFSLMYLPPIFLSQHGRPLCFILCSQKHHGKSGHVDLGNNASYCVQIFFSITTVKGLLFENLHLHSGPSGVI